MTRANILLTRNGFKTICVIDSDGYPESLPDILFCFDEWVSEWNEQRINAEYAYEINFEERTVRGWVHECRTWNTYEMRQCIKESINDRIKPLLPEGWTLNDDTDPVQVDQYETILGY